MYDYKAIENKWNSVWKNNKTFKVLRDRLKTPFYALCGYNSPSIDSFIKIDALCRYQRMLGKNVMYPVIKENASDYLYGIGMDYSKVINKRFLYNSQKQILEYLVSKDVVIEETLDGITNYKADVSDFYEIVNKMSLPESTKEIKKEFFNLKDGYNIYFEVQNIDIIIKLYLEELEKLFLATFIVIPYDSDIASQITNEEEIDDLFSYSQNPVETDLIFTGSYITNPITEQTMPIFIGNVKNVFLGVPALDKKAIDYATKYDLEVQSMDYFDDFSLHLRNQAFSKLSSLNMIDEITKRDKKYINLAQKENDKLTFDEYFNSIRFVIAPIASNIDLDINIIDYQDEINKWLPIDVFVFQDSHELFSSLLIHHLLNRAGFIHNNIFAKKIVYQNPKVVHNNDNSDLCRLMAFSNVTEEVGANILNKIWNVFKINLSENFEELELSYLQLIKDTKAMYEKRDYNMVIVYVLKFISLINEKKGMSYQQAFGLIKMLSPIVPYISEEIYQTLFNNLDSITYEDYPM